MCFFFFNDTATTEIYTLSLHDALPISLVLLGPPEAPGGHVRRADPSPGGPRGAHRLDAHEGRHGDEARAQHDRSEEHTSELQSLAYLVCRLLLEKKKNIQSNGYDRWIS